MERRQPEEPEVLGRWGLGEKKGEDREGEGGGGRWGDFRYRRDPFAAVIQGRGLLAGDAIEAKIAAKFRDW